MWQAAKAKWDIGALHGSSQQMYRWEGYRLRKPARSHRSDVPNPHTSAPENLFVAGRNKTQVAPKKKPAGNQNSDGGLKSSGARFEG